MPVEKKPRIKGQNKAFRSSHVLHIIRETISRPNVDISGRSFPDGKKDLKRENLAAFMRYLAGKTVKKGGRGKCLRRRAGERRAQLVSRAIYVFRAGAGGYQWAGDPAAYPLVQKYASWRWYFEKSSQPRQ